MDLFGTLELLGVVQQAGTAPTFLRDTFFGNVQEHDTAKIALDYESEGRQMAPFLSGQVAGKVFERGTFTTSTFEAPYVRHKFITSAEDFIRNRVPGEAPTGALTPEQRAAMQLGKDLGIQDRAITRREEWMCAKLLFTGSCPIKGDGVDAALTFWTAGSGTAPYTALGSTAQWDKDTADIYETLRAEQEKAVDDSGVLPDTAVLSKTAAAALLKNAAFMKLLDNRRVEIGSIQPRHLPDGVQFIGTVTALDLDLYTYTGKFEDENGTLTDYVPAGLVLLGKAGAASPAIMNYGVVAVGNEQQNELEYFVGRRVPEYWVSRSPAGRFLQTSARPLPVVTKPSAFRVLEVLA